MRPFGFAKDVGRRVFGKETEADQKLRELLEADNPGIRDLEVHYEDGVVSLSGRSDDPEAVEKAVLMAGNVAGVAEVKIDALQAPPISPAVDYYEIVAGDTLSKIAQRFYGDANAYDRIFQANREVIKDANLIFVGQRIRIPHQSG